MLKRNEAQKRLNEAFGVKGRDMYQLADERLFKVIHRTIFVDEEVLAEYIRDKRKLLTAQKAFAAKWRKTFDKKNAAA